jgi:hypothetical protein
MTVRERPEGKQGEDLRGSGTGVGRRGRGRGKSNGSLPDGVLVIAT